MSFKDCLRRSVDAGEVDPDKAQQALDLYDDLEADGAFTTDASLAQKTFDILQFEAFQKKRQRMLQVLVSEARFQEMVSYVNAHGQKDMAAGFRALHDRDPFAPFDNVESRRKEILGRAHSMFEAALATFRRNLVGETRNKANLRNMVREVFGQNTGDRAAKELAESWVEVSEFLRKRANASGMAIPKRVDWGMPQLHDSLKVREMDREEWVAFVRPLLDMEKMVDYMSGTRPNDVGIQVILGEVWETISTRGFSNAEPSMAAGKRKLANRRSDHRFLVFKDVDAWLTYHDRFGEGDAFSVMMGHIDGMARDIAQLEIFGPNPEATRKFLKDSAKRSAIAKDAEKISRKGKIFKDWEGYTNSVLNQSDNMMDAFTGSLNSPVHTTVARTMSGFRSLHAAAVLGSAMISALTDVNYQRMAARYAGLPQTRVVQETLANVMALKGVERGRVATRLGLIAEQWSTVGSAQMRYLGEVEGPEIARRISDFVLRVSGLSPWTQANRWGFGMAFLGDLADNSGKLFNALDPRMQKLMKQYGISPDDWNVMRTTEKYDASLDVDGWSGPGTLFMRPENLMKRTDISPEMADQVANKFLRMVQSETEFAVPTVSLKGRVQIIGSTRPGTIQGEFLRSVAMYKTFPLTILNTHINRILSTPGAGARGKLLADYLISTTLMGGMALQLKEVVKGKDPRPMKGDDAAKFWLSASVQGGGMGLYGDFLFGDLNRFGGGLPQQLAGPAVEFLDDTLRRAMIGNVLELSQGKDTNFGREMIRLMRRYTPGGSIWYTRLGYERLVLDQLQLWADPNARRNLRQQRQRFRNTTGQRFWWNPGTTSPQRLPEATR